MSKNIDELIQDLKYEINKEIKENEEKVKKIDDEKEKYRNILMRVLSSKIGEEIYWASKDWNNIETHKIENIDYAKIDTCFWGAEYKNKYCIRIICKDGYFLADNIGKTLFFNKDEAIEHSHLNEKT